MLGDTFQHDSIRKYTILFGALFNNIYINRHNSADSVIQKMKIPVSYGPKEKMLTRVRANPEGVNQVAITLPRISFELKTIAYDPDRKFNSLIRKSAATANTNIRTSVYNPVPYNLGFTVWVMTKNVVDGTRIIEQILPTFKPQYTVAAEIIPALEINHDIPVILDSVQVEDEYEGNFEVRRSVVWTLQFMVKGFMYGGVANTGLIKSSEITMIDMFSNTELGQVIVRPGLTANGEPTTNAAASIAYTLIDVDDDWAYIVDLEADV